MGNPNENIDVARRWYEEQDRRNSKSSGTLSFILLLGLIVAVIVAFAILCGLA